jgi:hypothetical protein
MANKKAIKKKNKKTTAKLKKKSASNRKIVKKTAIAKKSVAKKATPKKKKQTAVKTVVASKTKSAVKKTQSVPTKKSAPRKQIRRTQRLTDEPFSSKESRARSGGQSGDLQGLSNVDQADSESVDELLEEGNAFEADVVAGVEEAGDSEGREVHTHEVPEDDVPGEYLDEE